MGHAAQVGIDLPLGADAHEDGPPAGALGSDADAAQHVLRHDVGRLASQVDVLGRERVGGRRQTLGARGVVAVRVARTRVGARSGPRHQAQAPPRSARRCCPAPRPPHDPRSSPSCRRRLEEQREDQRRQTACQEGPRSSTPTNARHPRHALLPVYGLDDQACRSDQQQVNGTGPTRAGVAGA